MQACTKLESEKNSYKIGNIEKRTFVEVTCTGQNSKRKLIKTNNSDNKDRQNIHINFDQ